MINRLYSILTSGCLPIPEDDYYRKKTTPVRLTDRMQTLLNAITGSVPVRRLPMYACFLCFESINSDFGAEILARDPVNTYDAVSRRPDAGAMDSALCLHDLIVSSDTLKSLIINLDKDLQERLAVADWLEMLSAICLQLLRLADND